MTTQKWSYVAAFGGWSLVKPNGETGQFIGLDTASESDVKQMVADLNRYL